MKPATTRAQSALVVMLIVAGLGACKQNEPVTIGVPLGAGEINAVRLALDEATSAGLPVQINPMYIVAANTRAAPALRAAEQMTAAPNLIAVVGHNNSAASLAAAPIYNRHEVVQLSPNATAVLYSQAGPFSFRLVSPDDRQGKFIAERVKSGGRGRRVALLYVNDDYGRGLRNELMAAIPAGTIDWVMDTPHMEGLGDVSTRVTALADARPELIVWLGRGLELAKLLPGIRKQVGAVVILGSDAVAATAMQVNDGRWDGVQFVDLLDLDATADLRAMRERYKVRFGRLANAAEVLAYDATNVLIAAVRAGARTGAEVQQYLNELGHERPAFQGVAGPISFDANGDVARSYVLKTVQPSP